MATTPIVPTTPKSNSFLRIFQSVLHAIEAAAAIISPIVQAVNPVVGALMGQAVNVAIAVEGAIETPNSGAQKQQVVQASTQATIDLINSILKEQNKPVISNTVSGAVIATATNAVNALNIVANTVQPK